MERTFARSISNLLVARVETDKRLGLTICVVIDISTPYNSWHRRRKINRSQPYSLNQFMHGGRIRSFVFAIYDLKPSPTSQRAINLKAWAYQRRPKENAIIRVNMTFVKHWLALTLQQIVIKTIGPINWFPTSGTTAATATTSDYNTRKQQWSREMMNFSSDIIRWSEKTLCMRS